MLQATIPPVIILDSCVLINLLASEEAEAILRATGKECRICAIVKSESLYLRPDDPQEDSFEPISLAALIKSGVLSLCDIEGDQEAALFVDYASRLDDGEAMSMAIAQSRSHILATDDRKAQRIFLESVGDPQRLISTSELIRNWADGQAILPARLRGVLTRIQHKANFIPPRNDSNLTWWNNTLA